MTQALVLFSGGQDSTTCLYWAKAMYDEVTALSIDYGQRHINELEAAAKIAKEANVKHVFMKCPILADSALTNDNTWKFDTTGTLPNTWVPARNLVFISLAATLEIPNIVLGVCETDYSGYPDCRQSFIDAAQMAVRLASDNSRINIETPLMYLSKAKAVRMARKLEGCWEALAHTITCYEGTRCGACPACLLRARGFEEAGFTDPACSST